jgi:hypothetical protein
MWWGTDPEMTASALGLHQKLVNERGPQYVGSDEFQFGELEPSGLAKLAARVCEGNPNYTNFMNPAFRRTSPQSPRSIAASSSNTFRA